MPRTIGQKQIGELSVLSLLLESAASHGNRWHLLREHTLTEQPEHLLTTCWLAASGLGSGDMERNKD